MCVRKWNAGSALPVARRDAAVKFQRQTTKGQLQQRHCEQRRPPSPHNGLSCCSSDLHLNSRMLTRPPPVSSQPSHTVLPSRHDSTAFPTKVRQRVHKRRSIKEPSRVKISQQAQPCSAACDQHPTHTHTRPNKAGRHHCCCQRAQGLPRLRCSAAQVPACCPAGMLRSRPCLLALLLCTHVPAAHWAAPSALLSHSLIGQPSCALPQKEATPAIGPLMRLASCMSLGTAGHTHEPQQQPSTAQQQHGQPKAWSAATQHAQPTCWWLVLVVQMLCAGGACCCCQCLAHRAAVHVFRRRAPAAAPNTCQHAEMVGEASSHKRSGGPHGTHALRTKRATAAYAASA